MEFDQRKLNQIRSQLDIQTRNREINKLHVDGYSVVEIAAAFQLEPNFIDRVLSNIASFPILIEESPTEIINRHLTGEFNHDEMITKLKDFNYTYDNIVGSSLTVGAVLSGSWKQVNDAFVEGRISEEDYTTLLNHVYSKKTDN